VMRRPWWARWPALRKGTGLVTVHLQVIVGRPIVIQRSGLEDTPSR
jgi:hypothetical protein